MLQLSLTHNPIRLTHCLQHEQTRWACFPSVPYTCVCPLTRQQGDPTSHSKGNHPWIFIGRTDPEAEAPILWPPDAKSWFTGKDPDAGKDWRQEEKGTTEDELIGWHHWFNGHECEQTLGDSERHGNLACCSPWGHKELDTTEGQNSNSNKAPQGQGSVSSWLYRSTQISSFCKCWNT